MGKLGVKLSLKCCLNPKLKKVYEYIFFMGGWGHDRTSPNWVSVVGSGWESSITCLPTVSVCKNLCSYPLIFCKYMKVYMYLSLLGGYGHYRLWPLWVREIGYGLGSLHTCFPTVDPCFKIYGNPSRFDQHMKVP